MATQLPREHIEASKQEDNESNDQTSSEEKEDKEIESSQQEHESTDAAREEAASSVVTSNDENSDASPPVHEVSVDDGSTSSASHVSHGRLPLPSLKLLFYAMALWCGVLVVVISLERAGMTENITDMRLEEFLSRTGWANSHDISSYTSPIANESDTSWHKKVPESSTLS